MRVLPNQTLDPVRSYNGTTTSGTWIASFNKITPNLDVKFKMFAPDKPPTWKVQTVRPFGALTLKLG
jgi:hypothetical protein